MKEKDEELYDRELKLVRLRANSHENPCVKTYNEQDPTELRYTEKERCPPP